MRLTHIRLSVDPERDGRDEACVAAITEIPGLSSDLIRERRVWDRLVGHLGSPESNVDALRRFADELIGALGEWVKDTFQTRLAGVGDTHISFRVPESLLVTLSRTPNRHYPNAAPVLHLNIRFTKPDPSTTWRVLAALLKHLDGWTPIRVVLDGSAHTTILPLALLLGQCVLTTLEKATANEVDAERDRNILSAPNGRCACLVGIGPLDPPNRLFNVILVTLRGEPENTGRILIDHYRTKERVRELLDLGDLESLGPEIGSRHDFDNPPADQCQSYHRDLDGGGYGPTSVETDEALAQVARFRAIDYIYLFQDRRWTVAQVRTTGPLRFTDLESYLTRGEIRGAERKERAT